MRDHADFQPIRNVIEGCWPGEWGTDPIGDQSNCTVYRATDIDDEGHLSLDAGAARVVIPAKLTAKAFRKGDLLLEAAGGAPDRPVGRVALVATQPSKPSLTSNFFRFMRPKANIDSTYLTFQLVALNRSPAIWRYQQQTTGLINLKVHDYLGHPVWTPPLPTQRKIASILSTIDTAIEQTEALIEKYQHIKAGLMHDLFTRGVRSNGQLRPPREQAPELYQETAIGWLPREWRLSKAGDLCSLITKGTTPASSDMWESSEGIRFLRVDNLTFDGRFDFTASSYRISDMTHSTVLSRSKCVTGDVLMNIVGPPLGKVSLVTSEVGEVNINQAIAVFRPTASLSSIYLLRWLLSTGAKRWLLQRAKQTSGQLNLTLAMCQELQIPLPNIEEQGMMEMRLQAAERLVQSEITLLKKLQTQKLGLMQDLLTGKVPVTVDASPSEAVA